MKPRLCQYANCQIETSTPIIVNDGRRKERGAFCGRTHAALYLLKQEGHTSWVTAIEDAIAMDQEMEN